MELVGVLIGAALVAGTPLLLAGLGLLAAERAGVVNLGGEGMMVAGALAAFAAARAGDQPWIGFAAGIAAGLVLAMVFGSLALTLRAGQLASGLGVTLFAGGLAAWIGQPWLGSRLPFELAPVWADVPYVPVAGAALLSHTAPVYFAAVACALLAWVLARTRAGLVWRAVGESPQSAYRCGLPVAGVRWLGVLFSGVMCGLAGAFIVLAGNPAWNPAIIGGRGWIALALTAFAGWRPWRLLVGAYLVGAVVSLAIHLPVFGVRIATPWLAMLPYLATIAALVLVSRRPDWIRRNMPAALGREFVPD